MITKISYLGLGTMGGGMAPNLSKDGYELTVWNRSAEKCESFARKGARVADTAMRSILIFDNHPESLRLVSKLRVRPDVDPAARRAGPAHLMFGCF
jgi:6-phosphogluconate dehydrogenase